MFDLNFKDKIVLVTGASRGIGKQIAMDFASLGATVCGSATTQEGAQKITEYLNGSGFGFVMNSLDKSSIETMFKEVCEKVGSPDILVNNAGITKDNLFMRMKDEDWDDVIACNLTAVAKLSKLAMQGMMKKRFGRIINITSIVGQIGNAGQCNYAAAKAGLVGFSKSLAKELASRSITVNCVAPGFIQTDMTAVLKQEQLDAWINTIPLKKVGMAEDISGAVVFLASNMASYITGATIDVNGGLNCD